MNSAYVTHSAFWNADEKVVERIKLSTLLFDKLLWPVADPVRFAHVTAKVAAEPIPTGNTLDALSGVWSAVPRETPAYNIWTIDDKAADVLDLNLHSDLLAATKQALRQSGLDADKHYDDHKLAHYTMSEILYWRTYLPAATFLGHQISDDALHNFSMHEEQGPSANDLKVGLPTLAELNWNDLAALRKSPYLQAFRSKFEEDLERRPRLPLGQAR